MRKLKVFPADIALNLSYCSWMDMVKICNFFNGSWVMPDLDNIFFDKFMVALLFATGISRSALQNAVMAIVVLRSYPKMKWIHAKRRIAPMQNKQTVWDIVTIDYPRRSVGWDLNWFRSIVRAKPKTAISISYIASKPQPTTRIWFWHYETLKAFLKGLFCFHDYNYALA